MASGPSGIVPIMEHRHLNTSDLTSPPCVEDIILRGLWADWVALHRAALSSEDARAAIVQVCAPNAEDPYNQRHIFWLKHVHQIS